MLDRAHVDDERAFQEEAGEREIIMRTGESL